MSNGGRKPNCKHVLIDEICRAFNIKTDDELSKAIGFCRFTLSKIRNRTRSITPDFILCVHDFTNWPIAEIKKLAQISIGEQIGNKENTSEAT